MNDTTEILSLDVVNVRSFVTKSYFNQCIMSSLRIYSNATGQSVY